MAVSSSFNKCACGCFGDSSVIVEQSITIEKEMSSHRPRRNTASTVSSFDDLKVDPALSLHNSNTKYELATSNNNTAAISKKNKQAELMKYAQLPSGLSVESHDSLEESLSGGNYAALLFPPRPPTVPILTKAAAH